MEPCQKFLKGDKYFENIRQDVITDLLIIILINLIDIFLKKFINLGALLIFLNSCLIIICYSNNLKNYSLAFGVNITCLFFMDYNFYQLLVGLVFLLPLLKIINYTPKSDLEVNFEPLYHTFKTIGYVLALLLGKFILNIYFNIFFTFFDIFKIGLIVATTLYTYEIKMDYFSNEFYLDRQKHSFTLHIIILILCLNFNLIISFLFNS